jgi:uncharacterized protein (TIGR03435 family)
MAEPITPELVQSGRLQMGVTIDAHYTRIHQLSLVELVSLAYQVKGYQLSAQPWMKSQRYDIQAKLPEGGTRGQVPAMVQTLLAQRLGLKVHRETRQMQVYALVVAKDGHKLKPAEGEAPAPSGQIRGGTVVSPSGQMATVGVGGDSRVTTGENGNVRVESKRMTMARFADTLNRYCELPVVNLTELEGAYELEVDVSGEELRNAARAHGAVIRAPSGESASDPSGVSLRGSLEKLGLRLEARKLPMEVIVLDDALKVPTEN